MVRELARPQRILFVVAEDSTYLFHLHDYLINDASVIVSLVYSIVEAEDCLSQTPPDVLILDDTATGIALLKITASRKPTKTFHPLITFISDDPSYLKSHADLILPPIHPSFLMQVLTLQLHHHQHHIAQHQTEDAINILKTSIVHTVSHELKTPLLQVKSAIALIAEDSNEDRLVQMAVAATTRLEDVVKKITLLADSLNGHFGVVLVQESLDQAIRNLRRSWAHKDAVHRVECHISPSLPAVMSDKQGLGIVLQELIDNALKFSAPDTPVIVEISRVNNGVKISVNDRGIGIAPDKTQQIFDSFYQIDSSSTKHYGGIGVGLAIVQLILEKQNVLPQVDSVLGKYSRFWFVLPLADLL